MDVNTVNFAYYLPEMLNDISCSSFVAFDLEFTGVPRLPGQGVQNQTLQQRYADNKAAAEKYQVLQVGLTMCRENPKDATYIMKTYNVHLSPFVERSLDINRDWMCMSWAVEFLLGNNFSVDKACKDGVRYLSREEEAECLRIAEQKYSLGGAQDAINAEGSNQNATAFFNTVRHQINSWLAQDKKSGENFLNIPAPSHARRNYDFPTTLTNMQKRLVHVLVRAEYPTLRSRSKTSGFVQIEILGPERDNEEEKRAAQINTAKEKIQKSVGFRWIIEALIGGDLTGIEEKNFKYLMDLPEHINFTQEDLVDRVKLRLKRNRPILVGHNCMLDLMFLYSCFIGPLPDTVVGFQKLIHGLFPMIVDTKYLATLDSSYASGTRSSLEEINRGLAKATLPNIEVEPSHPKYFYRNSAHEAGYDSMLSAVAFLRLSVQLAKGKAVFSYSAKLEEMRIRMAKEIPLVKQVAQQMQEDTICVEESSSSGSEDLIELSDGDTAKKYCRPAPFVETGDSDIAAKIVQGLLLPRAGANFWRFYANRLRVFGTVEGMVQLGDM